MGGSFEEKRKYKRAEDIFIVTYRLKSAIDVSLRTDQNREYAAVAMDISAGGIGVDVDKPLEPGMHLRLKFTIVNSLAASESDRQRMFELDGQATHCSPTNKRSFHVGIRFQEISVADSEYISDYVRIQQLKKFDTA